jgi:cytochrome c peroxidase
MNRTLLPFATLVLLVLPACRSEAPAPAPVEWPQIKSYAPMAVPADNPMTPAKVELGKQLYYDQRLSGDSSRSCYSCHLAEKGLTDGLPKAIGAYGVEIPRSAPTMWNIGYHKEFYWDGRSATLEAQAKAAWAGGNMGAAGKDGKPSVEEVCARLNAIEGYRKQFQAVFGRDCAPDDVAKALAAFMRTIVANHTNSAWVRFREGNQNALSEQARRGYQVFSDVAKCTNCHDGVLLTDLQFHTVGIGWDAKKKEFADVGRFKVSNDEKQKGAFKTPTLLDIAESAPYFHDGSVATLEEAVDLMLAGGIKNPVGDPNLEPRQLTPEQRADLLAFLRALNADYRLTPPQLPQ